MLGAQLIDTMRAAGATDAQIDAAMTAQLCLIPVPSSGPPPIVPMSVGSDLRVYAPSWYSDPGGWYNVYANYTWINDNYREGSQWPGGNVGGPDGFAISFNTPMVWVPGVRAQFTYLGKPGGHFGYTYDSTPDTQTQYGAGFMDQDTFWAVGLTDLNMYRGTIATSMYGPVSGCQNVQAFASYSHTWSSTSVTGIAVGPYSIGFSWNTSSNRWNSAGPGSAVKRLCA